MTSVPEPVASDEAVSVQDQMPWTVMVVDDDADVHAVTRLVLSGLIFAGRPLRLIHAFSAGEAEATLRHEPDVAVLLLDVVMETQEAGLDLVRTIRETLQIGNTRIILRTGQPGRVPEHDIIIRYDINDYRDRSELTESRLLSVVVAGLRAYDRLCDFERQRDELARLNRSLEMRIAERTQDLRDSEGRLRSILNTSVLPIFISAIADGRVLYANETAQILLGLVESRQDLRIWHQPEDRQRLLDRIAREEQVQDFEARVQAIDGRLFWALVAGITITLDDRPGLLVSISDISSRKAMEEELKRLATTDPLTGIPNRRFLMDQGDRELGRARRYGNALSVLILDIDHFKKINDRHGHAVGDDALKAMVQCCLRQLREIDILCRLGGEEFVALLPETPGEAAMAAAERLRDAVARMSLPLAGSENLTFTISVGVTAPREADVSLADMLSRADEALYEAKRNGRNRVTLLP